MSKENNKMSNPIEIGLRYTVQVNIDFGINNNRLMITSSWNVQNQF